MTAVESALGIRPTWHNGGHETPGATGSLIAAMLAVAAGLCRHVVCFRTVWQSSYGELARRGEVAGAPARRVSGPDEYLAPYGVQAVNTVAMAASQHMARYGTTRESLGWIALNARANAALNPTALYREPLTMDDYLGGPRDQHAVRPVRLRRAVRRRGGRRRVGGGCGRRSAASRLTSRRSACRSPSGWSGTRACSATSRTCSDRRRTCGPARRSARTTSTSPSCTTGSRSIRLSWIEALGFCEIGEAKDFLDGGKNIARDGRLPLNTNGGQLSHGRTHGMGLVHEAVTQLRGDAGPRQVRDAATAIVTSGGLTPGGVVLLRRDR